jgi:tetratricopeptide (TPR) repeat protein
MTNVKATLETSSAQIFTDLTTHSQTSPFSWTSWTTSNQSGLNNWFQKLTRAWQEQRFDDAIVQIDEYLDRIVPVINDVLLAGGFLGKANCHLAMGRYELALDFVEQAESKLYSHDSTLGEISVLDGAKNFINQYKGLLLLNLGRESEAIEMLRANPPTCSFVENIYRDIESKLGIELFDSKGTSVSSDFNSYSPTDLTGPERTLYEKLIGEWLSRR